MRLGSLFCWSSLVLLGSTAPLQKRDADFLSVRRKMMKDMSGKGGDPKEKYFHESVFHPHYDGRFTDHVLDYVEQKRALKNLLQTYLATFHDLGIETWLMHGTLLGWWWNKGILPWDSDIDVQISETSMYYLATYYNMSVFHYQTPRIPDGRDYMLEVNPHFKNREQTDKLNVIDARWIDTESGVFIDITTARYNLTHPEGEGMLSCKDGHEYRDTYIFPLRDTSFEGAPAKIPYRYRELLDAEYGANALVNKDFNGHLFDDNKMEWIPKKKEVKPIPPPPKKEAAQTPLQEQKKDDGSSADKPPEPKKPDQPKETVKEGGDNQQAKQPELRSNAAPAAAASQPEKKPEPRQPAPPTDLQLAQEKLAKEERKREEGKKKQAEQRREREVKNKRWKDEESEQSHS